MPINGITKKGVSFKRLSMNNFKGTNFQDQFFQFNNWYIKHCENISFSNYHDWSRVMVIDKYSPEEPDKNLIDTKLCDLDSAEEFKNYLNAVTESIFNRSKEIVNRLE